jgi:dipeptidyl aminopeptidase/acylaminoacyl peptidase
MKPTAIISTATQKVTRITSTHIPPTTTLLPTATEQSTETAIPNKPIITVWPTQTATPDVQVQCVQIETALPSDLEIEGSLILYGKDDTLEAEGLVGKDEVYLFDFDTLEKRLISPTEDGIIKWYDTIAVSPDGRWFAYNETFLDDQIGQEKYIRLGIMSATGQQLPLLSQPKEWGQIIGWLDNQQLALTVWRHNDGSVIVLNPFTGQSYNLSPDFPDLSPNASWYEDNNQPVVIYDPTHEKVVYFKGSPDNLWGNYALWDKPSQRLLWELPTLFYDNTRPVWSPDGMQFAVAGGVKDDLVDHPSSSILYLVTRYGEVTPIINEVSGFLSWSPNGRYLAFNDSFRQSVGILETSTKKITFYCMRGWSPAIWSPDGRWIVVNAPMPRVVTGVVVIDTLNNKAYHVIDNYRVQGWLTKSAK